MNHQKNANNIFENHLGCFGNFSPIDWVCRDHCAINIRCAIETDQNARSAILESLIDEENLIIKIQ